LNILNVQTVSIGGRSNYLEILESAWLQHLEPRKPDAPTVISTFAGCGGSSLGYSMAGFKELLAVEWDDNAVETFKLNFPDVPVYHGDIASLEVKEVMRLTGLKQGELDVLDGSPPCQGFSTAGKRNLNDSRNQLFWEFIRLLRELKPKVFVMENVSGMVKGKMKLIFAEIMRELKASGYKVSARLMNAMYFNVPQSRERMIFVGTREDLGVESSHPKANTNPIKAAEAIPELLATRSQRINPWIDSRQSAATLCRMEYGYQALAISQDELNESAIKDTWQMARVLKGIEKQKHFGLIRLEMDKPSPTIVKDAGNTTTGMIHPFEIRKLTISEIKRLASYPDDFRLIGSFKQKWSCIGNSVPPLFMRAIALHIKNNILLSCPVRRVN
jgi:DNA (cytosine-5)-methyltransferase 1